MGAEVIVGTQQRCATMTWDHISARIS